MAQPTPYDRQANFSDEEALNPTTKTPGASLDAEYNAVKISLDQTQANLALIQRDDGLLANGSVGADQLAPSLSIGFTLRGVWEAPESYVIGDGVVYDSGFWRAAESHVSTLAAPPSLSNPQWTFLYSIIDIVPVSIPDGSVTDVKLRNSAGVSVMGRAANSIGGVADIVAASEGLVLVREAGALAFSQVATAGLTDLAVTNAKLAADAVVTAKILDANVTAAKLASDSVVTAKILDANVTTAKLADAAVTSAKIEPTLLATFTAMPTGSVINSVDATPYTANSNLSSLIPFDNTKPQISEGTQILTASITPGSTTNKIRARFKGWGTTGTNGDVLIAAMFNGGTDAVQVAAHQFATGNYLSPLAMEWTYTPGTISAQTITVRVGSAVSTARMNGSSGAAYFGGAASCTLVLEEIKG